MREALKCIIRESKGTLVLLRCDLTDFSVNRTFMNFVAS